MRIVVAVLVALVLVGCGRAANNDVALGGQPAAEEQPTAGGGASPGSLAMCIEGATECNDMVVLPDEGGGSQGSPGTGEILCEGTEPTAAAPPGTDCSAPAEPEGREIKPAPDGLASVHPIGWDRYDVDGRRLTLHWYSGVEPCHVLHSVKVEETARRVTVTLREGTADANAACIEIAEAVKTTVRLDAPLGDREVVDGTD